MVELVGTRWVAIQDVVQKVARADPAKSSADVFTYVDLGSVDQHRKVIRFARPVSGSEAPSRARQVLKADDVLVSTVRPNLNGVAIVPASLEGSIASTGFCVLRPEAERLDPRYLFHWVQTPAFVNEMVRSATGASYPAVSDKVVLSSCMPLPPLDKQRRIAAVLDKTNALRVNCQRAVAQLDLLTQSVFQAMFPADAHQETALGDCLSFITSGGRGWSKYYSNSGSRFIRSLDVQTNFISNESEVFVIPPDNAEARRTRLKQGDVLLTITGSLIGRAAAITSTHVDAYVSQHVAILRPNTDLLSPIFLSYFLNLPHGGQKLIRASQYGQTKPGLNFEQIRGFAIPQASRTDQEVFEDRVASAERLKDRHRTQLSKLEVLFASLQSRAFTGDV